MNISDETVGIYFSVSYIKRALPSMPNFKLCENVSVLSSVCTQGDQCECLTIEVPLLFEVEKCLVCRACCALGKREGEREKEREREREREREKEFSV